jgi:prepilin-type N-terminal cleavage/methylation domain-containing protein
MKPSPIFLSAKSPRVSGFTLVEILVAIAILGVLILMLAQILGMVNNTFLYGLGKMNNFAKARVMLDILQNDFRAAVFRPDLSAFPTSGTGANAKLTVEFYTERPGIPSDGSGALRNVSLVQYALLNGTDNNHRPTSTLERSDMPVSWADPATYLAFGNSSGFGSAGVLTPRDTAPGVAAFQVLFMQADGSFSTTTFTPSFAPNGSVNANPTRSIGITLAVIDDQAMRLLSTNQLVNNLQPGLAQAVTNNSNQQNIKAVWEQYLTTLNWSSYPKNLGTGIDIFECYLPIQ